MYSRNTENNDYRVPHHYGGTAFRASETGESGTNVKRDAVGRISALHSFDNPVNETETDSEEKKDGEAKDLTPSFLSRGISKDKGKSIGSDEILIAALILLLLGGGDECADNSPLLILLLLLLF